MWEHQVGIRRSELSGQLSHCECPPWQQTWEGNNSTRFSRWSLGLNVMTFANVLMEGPGMQSCSRNRGWNSNWGILWGRYLLRECQLSCFAPHPQAYRRSKNSLSELLSSINLWQKVLKVIGGKFGTSVLSYFNFLRWLLKFNIFSFIVTFSFIIIPQLTVAAGNTLPFTGLEFFTGAVSPPFPPPTVYHLGNLQTHLTGHHSRPLIFPGSQLMGNVGV